MNLWPLFALAILAAWITFRLYGALSDGDLQFGPFKYNRINDRVWFWIVSSIYAVLLLFVFVIIFEVILHILFA